MIYWDHNSTSPLRSSVQEALNQSASIYLGNPNSIHVKGQECRGAIEETREALAKYCGCKPTEIIFTGSATEANFLALWNYFLTRKNPSEKFRVLSSPIEHSSVLENLLFLKNRFDADINFLKVDSSGQIDLDDLRNRLNTEIWDLCCVIGAQNETGIIQPYEEISSLCAEKNLAFHTDLVQLVGREAWKFQEMPSSYTLAFHKIGGPKGIGALIVKEGRPFESIAKGGNQEKKRRPGTENVNAIIGLKALLQELPDIEDLFRNQIRPLKAEFESSLKNHMPHCTIIGESAPRLTNTSYIIFPQIKSDVVLMNLSLKQICVGSGSACSSGLVLPSKTLLAMGFSEAQALSAVRFSLGAHSTQKESASIVEALHMVFKRMAA